MNKTEAEDKQNKLQANFITKLDTSQFTAHKQSVEDVVTRLGTSMAKGLTQDEAKKRL